MIGNDIVDLALAQKESNWKRKGFLDKIFTQKEQLLISTAENPSNRIWDLWSRKEATYKIYNRKTQIRGFIPLKLECFEIENRNGILFGKVQINNFIFYTKTVITSQFINTIAVENIQYFDTIKILENRKNIRKNNGIPNYYEYKNSPPRPTSISNHGRFEQIITI